ncbi:MAG: response regulator [archaeon]
MAAKTLEKILLVENDACWQQIEKACLEKIGYQVEIADTALRAIELLQSNQYDLVISDLHMGGSELNGDALLSYIIQNHVSTRFALASGTITPEDKKTLTETIPFIHTLHKDGFTKRENKILKANIAYIIRQDVPDYSDKQEYVHFLTDFKLRAPPADIRVTADRIKGKLNLLMQTEARHLAELSNLLSGYDYYGGPQPRETQHQLHSLKNLLIAYLDIHKVPKRISREIRTIASDLVVAVNSPAGDKVSLFEVVSRAKSMLEEVYQVEIKIEVPTDLYVSNSAAYISALYPLLENAAIAASGSKYKVVNIGIDLEQRLLNIRNSGNLPSEYLYPDGSPNLDNIKSTRKYGTGQGIKLSVGRLKEIGSSLRYIIGDKEITAQVGVNYIQETSETASPKKSKRILVYDHNDSKFGFLRDAAKSSQFPEEYVFEFYSEKEKPLKEIKTEEYDIVVVHPEGGDFINFFNFAVEWEKNADRPDLYVVSGSWPPGTFTENTSWSRLYNNMLSTREITSDPFSKIHFFEKAPGLDVIKSWFDNTYVSPVSAK